MEPEISTKLKLFRIVAIIITILGVVLLTYMIKEEDEPGAIPLFLTLAGIISFFIIQKKIKARIN
jgi:hypothetical protein